RASVAPWSVSAIPSLPDVSTRPFCSIRLIISEADAAETPINSATFVTVTGGDSCPISKIAFRYISAFSVLPMLCVATHITLFRYLSGALFGTRRAPPPVDHVALFDDTAQVLRLGWRRSEIGLERLVDDRTAIAADEVRVGSGVGVDPQAPGPQGDQPDEAKLRQLRQGGVHRLEGDGRHLLHRPQVEGLDGGMVVGLLDQRAKKLPLGCDLHPAGAKGCDEVSCGYRHRTTVSVNYKSC